eukprot:gene33127-40072_t
MGDISDYDFSGTDAGASHTYNMEAGKIREGGYICISGHPCKVDAVSTSTAGKHGHAKCNFTAIDIFTGKKYEDIIPATQHANVPVVIRTEYSLLDITEDGCLSLIDENQNLRDDIKLPEHPNGFAREIRAKFATPGTLWAVKVLSAMGHDQVTEISPESEGKK